MQHIEHKPNIVFVVLDTHRADRIGCYGYRRGTTSNLDDFAQQATVFENAIAPAQWTIPSHASMFSGEPPSTHLTVQSGDVLDSSFKTLAEHLRSRGYRTTGFCNNPLVGVLDNGLRRGFDTFYNYGGAIPSGPARPSPLGQLWKRVARLLRKVAYPIQNAFANSAELFQGALDPFWVPVWTRIANFKGNDARSIRDATQFIKEHVSGKQDHPHFLFINLMETHLPYSAPDDFVSSFAPQFQEDQAARRFMQAFNTRATDWFTPRHEPFSDLESRVLSGMYDAEVAYQDHLLSELLTVLDQPDHRDDTMVVFVADHGEMLGEHQLMGHGFGVYQELVHVPLLLRLPGQTGGQRVATPVSTTRLFHTVLEAAGLEAHDAAAVDVRSQSLTREVHEPGQSPPAVFCEAYAPEFALKAMEAHKPDLIERLNCRLAHRAVYEGRYKLICVEDKSPRLFSLDVDPWETRSLEAPAVTERIRRMRARLHAFLEEANARKPQARAQQPANLDDKIVQQRLRDLGYI